MSYQETCQALSNHSFSNWSQKKQKHGLQTQNERGNTPFEYAIWNNLLYLVPPKLFTKNQLLNPRDDAHATPLHLIAYRTQLHLVPPHLLTESLLLTPDMWGDTPLDGAIHSGCLHQIPKGSLRLQTLKNLLHSFHGTEKDKTFLESEIQTQSNLLKNFQQLKKLQQKLNPLKP